MEKSVDTDFPWPGHVNWRLFFSFFFFRSIWTNKEAIGLFFSFSLFSPFFFPFSSSFFFAEGV